ncbi:MAG: hypothetical protein C0467_27200 [Planctomycetaceae bacterium]|nr:hypothetical protein [Planctomycetaceae bacterium]
MNGSSSDDEPPRSNSRWLVGVLVLLTIPLVVIWWPGCRQYPAVTSKESLEAMKLLYSACNTRDPVRLGQVEQRVEKLVREGKMTPAESASFGRIVAMARAGNWQEAEDAAFKFAQDQVGAGSADHDPHDHAKDEPKAKPTKAKAKP